jgi:hypothetical protein
MLAAALAHARFNALTFQRFNVSFRYFSLHFGHEVSSKRCAELLEGQVKAYIQSEVALIRAAQKLTRGETESLHDLKIISVPSRRDTFSR